MKWTELFHRDFFHNRFPNHPGGVVVGYMHEGELFYENAEDRRWGKSNLDPKYTIHIRVAKLAEPYLTAYDINVCEEEIESVQFTFRLKLGAEFSDVDEAMKMAEAISKTTGQPVEIIHG